MEKLRSIQVLRGVAACAVVILHACPQVEMKGGHAVREIGVYGYGAFGVDLFFVISGFIMAKLAPGRSAGSFVGDRLSRIYPLWWIAVLPWLFFLPQGPAAWASSLTLWPIYAGGYAMPVLRVGWTLSFELLFYFAVALAIATRARVPLVAYAVFLVGALTTSSDLLHFVGSPMALEFLMGVLVASAPRRPGFGFLAVLGILLLALTSRATGDVDSTFIPQFALWRAVTWGVPAALILWGAISLESRFKSRLFDIPVALGDASYAVYLFHPIIAYGFGLPPMLSVIAAVAVGCMVHVVIEKRLLALRRRGLAALSDARKTAVLPPTPQLAPLPSD